MSEDAAPERIAVILSPEARADLRAIERGTAPAVVALRHAPIDDEPETGDEKQSAAGARDWLARRGGKGIPHDEAMQRLGLE